MILVQARFRSVGRIILASGKDEDADKKYVRYSFHFRSVPIQNQIQSRPLRRPKG